MVVQLFSHPKIRLSHEVNFRKHISRFILETRDNCDFIVMINACIEELMTLKRGICKDKNTMNGMSVEQMIKYHDMLCKKEDDE